uniref:Sulfotransferase family protein n=1 Tax=Alexandrium catenella TaxID=2925 RepID=A0A7S1QM46_ALECA
MAKSASAAGRKPVMFVHVHKSGGSTMCHWATAVGERLDPYGAWCATMRFADFATPADYARSPGPGRETATCQERAQYFKKQALSWNVLEHELCRGDLCFDDFVYFTVLRETLDRIASQVNYEGPIDVDGVIRCIELSNASACPVSYRETGHARSWVFIDNLVVRMFGGCNATNAPPGRLTRAHLDAAVRNLDRFAAVIPLANLSSPRGQAAMDRVVGWHVPPDTEQFCQTDYAVVLTPVQAARLRELNRWDVELVGRYLAAWEAAEGGRGRAPGLGQAV